MGSWTSPALFFGSKAHIDWLIMKDPLKLVDVFRLDWETQQHPTFQLLVLSVISKKKKTPSLISSLEFFM